ncbi:MAG: tRNA-dihydrouridine synthase [Planctomycetota bacterium]
MEQRQLDASAHAADVASDSGPAALQIGSLRLDVPVLSAPVAGFSDLVFRGIVRDFGGCGLIYAEMVSAGGWLSSAKEPVRLRGVRDEAKPVGVQLWDREPAHVEEAARRLRDYGVSVIDLNFGCPKQRIMGKQGAGAKLLRDPETVGRMVAATVRGAGETPVTAKIRLGPHRHQQTAVAVAQCAADNGAAAVTVHGRSAGDGYGVPARREAIAEVVAAVDVPVIANGDVDSGAAALATLRDTGAAAVMVARAALSRPWIFREIAAALRGEAIPAPPTLAQQREQLLRHFDAVLALDGDIEGTIRMRKFACRYLAGVRGARAFRAAISQANDPRDFHRIVAETFPEIDPRDDDPAHVSYPEERCA